MKVQKYIEWELENNPRVYDKPRCNEFIDRQTIMHIICKIDCTDGVTRDSCNRVLCELIDALEHFQYFKPEGVHDKENEK